MPAVAVTDHGNMFGAFHFFHEALQNGVRPIIGVEAYIAPGDRTDREEKAASESGEGYAYHLTILAATQKGYRNLVRLVSEAYLSGFYHRPRMDKELLREHAEGLIGLSGCLKGEVAGSLSRGNFGAAKKAFLEYEDIFGKGNFFVELMDHGLPQQTAIVPDLLRLATETGAPAVATNDSHYLRRDDAFPHEVLLCIGMGKTLEDERRMRFYNDEFYVKSPDEMLARFKLLERRGRHEHRRDRRALRGLLRHGWPPPSAVHGARTGSRPPTTSATSPGRASSGASPRTSRRCREARADRAREVPRAPGVRDRRHREDGLPVLLPDRLRLHPPRPGEGHRRRARAAAAPPARSSRGRSGSPRSTRCEYDLLFERFLNPERISMPDIDIDFCQARRGEVIEYVTKRVRPRERGPDRDLLAVEAQARGARRRARAVAAGGARGPDRQARARRPRRQLRARVPRLAGPEGGDGLGRVGRQGGAHRRAARGSLAARRDPRRRRRHRAPAHHRIPAALPDQQGRNHDAVRHERRREDGPAQDRLSRPDHARRPGSHGRRRARAAGRRRSTSTTCLWTTSRRTSSSVPGRRPASSSSTPAACATSCGGPSRGCSPTSRP